MPGRRYMTLIDPNGSQLQMRFNVMFKGLTNIACIRALALASVFSLLAAGSMALAGDGGPGNPGDHNGRGELVIDSHSMMAGGRGGISGEVYLPPKAHR